jgi:hypothetical protein
MNELDIKDILYNTEGTDKAFAGVYSSNERPQFQRGKCYILNTQCICSYGEHWISVYYPRLGPIEIFCSFGYGPNTYQFLNIRKNYKYNNKQLQSLNSTTCGHYCCAFLIHRTNGFSFNQFINLFTNNTEFNDRLVQEFIRTNYNVSNTI